MAKGTSSTGLLSKQLINRRVMLALLPCVAASIYYFGWRSLVMVLWAAIVGFITEYHFTQRRKEPVSEAVFVTTTIVALIMPPTIGWHILTIAVVFAIAFTKEIFGGYRYNIFNPAMAGRCFVYVCFPVAMTAVWAPVANGPLGALDKWSTVSAENATTGATPMSHLKAGRIVLESRGGEDAVSYVPADVPEDTVITVKSIAFYKALVLGNVSGTVGVTSVIAILLGGIYLYWTKTANRSIILSLLVTYIVLNQGLFWLGVEPVPGALPALLGGGFLFGSFFMATDPISAPKTDQAKIFYGIIIALSAVVIRNFSIFNGGLMFSILIGNMFAPILDYAVRANRDRKKARAAA